MYGWTDTPSILTESTFVALSPHGRLLRPGLAKGFTVDFLNPGNDQGISDQLEAFKLVSTDLDQKFLGTIIRIPFRTKEQAETSEINKLSVTPEEILQHFQDFQNDVAESLVFMKSIERVAFYLNGTELGNASIINIETVREMRAAVASAILSESAVSCSARFEISLKYNHKTSNLESTRTYQICQTILDLRSQKFPEKFKLWASDAKLFPWIALAARLDEGVVFPPTFSRIFVTLPLPEPLDCTRVNVHGIFSLRRDRRSLWTDKDAQGGTTMREILWNRYLFKTLMPLVWKDLLVGLAQSSCLVYDYFPLMSISLGSPWATLAEDVLKRILSARCPIWHSTTNQYLPLEEGVLVANEHNEGLLNCLEELSMPMFRNIPDNILRLIQRCQHPYTKLTPSSVREWLRSKLKHETVSVAAAMQLLQYISEDEKMDQLNGLPLFLCKDGQLRSLMPRGDTPGISDFKSKLYIGTEEESALFDKTGGLFLALDKYPPTLSTRIQGFAQTSEILNIEIFRLQTFVNFAHYVLFSSLNLYSCPRAVIQMSSCGVNLLWIQKLWLWLDRKPVNEVAEAVNKLWLLPLKDGKSLRKVYPLGKIN